MELLGHALADWSTLKNAMVEAGVNTPLELANWLVDKGNAVVEERARTMLAEAKLSRIKKIIGVDNG